MATEEKKEDDEEKKEEEIKKSSGFRWKVSLSIIVSIGWLVFLILWFAFYASNYTVYQNIAIILVSILIMCAILGASWASWGIKYGWKDENDKGKKGKEWWQLKRIWFGFFIIIFVIAFGIAQPFLWYRLFEIYPPIGVIDVANLLLILITLLAVGLTGFSVLIYESLQMRLSTRITQDIQEEVKEVHKRIEEGEDKILETEDAAHEHIKEHVKKTVIELTELSNVREKKTEIRQTLFRAQILKSLGHNYWQLFLVWEEVKLKKSAPEIQAKKISERLIRLAIEKAKMSLDSSEKLPEQYKKDKYQCKNNWIYFLAEAARVKAFEPTREDKKLALKFSDEILKEVSKKDYRGYYHYWESCAWALQHLSEKEDENLKQKAHDIIRELLNDKDILLLSPSWHGEIENNWADFLEEKNDTSASIKNT